jgi:hypothetical protein
LLGDLGVRAEDIITHPDDTPPPISRLGKERSLADFDRLRAQRAAKYGFQLLGIPLDLPEFISKSVKDKLSGLYAQWKPVIKFKDTQSAWLMYSMCLSRSINHMCRHIPTAYIMEHASIFDDNLRRGIREILSQTWSGPDLSYLWIWEALVFLIFTTLLNLVLLLLIRIVSNIPPSIFLSSKTKYIVTRRTTGD